MCKDEIRTYVKLEIVINIYFQQMLHSKWCSFFLLTETAISILFSLYREKTETTLMFLKNSSTMFDH